MKHFKKTLSLLVLSFVTCSWLPLSAQGSKHSADLDSATSGNVHVVISFKTKPSAEFVKNIAAAGGTVQRQLNEVNTIIATVPAGGWLQLESDANVTYIASDRPVHSTLDYSSAAVNGNVAFQSGHSGAGIGIAIVDSGVSSHPDLNEANGKSRILYSQSFVAGDSSTSDE